MEWREQDGVRWLEAELTGAKAAFSTRVGGLSAAPFESMNLGVLTGDDPADVRGNRRKLAAALALDPERVVIGRQVHGSEIAHHGGPQSPAPFADSGSDPPEVDGHAIRDPGLAGLVFVADCLPIALSGPEGVAMLHCGWRGMAAGVIERGVEAVNATSAAVGPGIGQCCYEVGPEVRGAFADRGVDAADERGNLDLSEAARQLLTRAGVESAQFAGICTKCHPELFFSHRRDGARTGRQAGLAWLENGEPRP